MGLFSKETQAIVDRSPETPRKSGETAPADVSTTIIARGTTLEGLLKGSPDLRVEGEVSGEIRSSSRVVVGSSGRVKALIRARTIQVAGRVEGDLTADERIELASSAAVVGNLLAPRILIKEGANLQGSVEMSSPAAEKEKKTQSGVPRQEKMGSAGKAPKEKRR